jgi:subtilisin family serine protease
MFVSHDARFRAVVPFLWLSAAIALVVLSQVVVAQSSMGDRHRYADGVLVVDFKARVPTEDFSVEKGAARTKLVAVDALLSKYRAETLEPLFVGASRTGSQAERALSGYYRITFASRDSLEMAFADFSARNEIDHVERVSIHEVDLTPNDPSFGSQWGLSNASDQDLDAPEAWNTATGDSAILVGAMDTGVQWQHPDLAGPSPFVGGNIWTNLQEYNGALGVDDDGNGYIDDIHGWDWVTGVTVTSGEDGNTPDNDPMDFNGHGTHTAGIMAAITNNGVGVAGMAGGWSPDQRGCRIVPLRIGWSQTVSGQERGYVRMDFAAQAFYYAANLGVTSVNCSWGSSNDGGIAAALDYAASHGVVVVSAAGNDNTSTAPYLCSRTDVLSVASITSTGARSSFSNYGTWVDVSAPGSNIYSTYSNHGSAGYATLSGTSMAAPFVAGLAGLLKSRAPYITKNALDTLIISTTDNIDAQNPTYIGRLGTGRINAATAVSQLFTADFFTDQRFGRVPFAVNLSAMSSDSVSQWLWRFGDGDSAWGQNVVHIYAQPGRYDVQLKITGPQGSSTNTKTSYVVAHADSLVMQSYSGRKTDALVYEFRLHNYAPITSLTLPITYSGNMDISLDSISFVDTRGMAFEYRRLLSSSSSNYRFTVGLIADDGGGSPPLEVGDGVLFRAYFKYDAEPPIPGHNIVDTTRYSTYALATGSSFGTYAIAIGAGAIDIHGQRGDADRSGAIDIGDAVYLISYIFAGGQPPASYEGDADSSGAIDVSDAVYLISFIFGGGPPPLD